MRVKQLFDVLAGGKSCKSTRWESGRGGDCEGLSSIQNPLVKKVNPAFLGDAMPETRLSRECVTFRT